MYVVSCRRISYVRLCLFRIAVVMYVSSPFSVCMTRSYVHYCSCISRVEGAMFLSALGALLVYVLSYIQCVVGTLLAHRFHDHIMSLSVSFCHLLVSEQLVLLREGSIADA